MKGRPKYKKRKLKGDNCREGAEGRQRGGNERETTEQRVEGKQRRRNGRGITEERCGMETNEERGRRETKKRDWKGDN